MKKQLWIVFCLAALCLAQGVWGQVWDGKIDSEWYWENAEETEFTIATAAQLAGLAQLVNGGNNFSGKTVKLTANIMLNDTTSLQNWNKASPKNAWTPIGSYTENNSRPFSGVFDGGGKVISGVYISSSDNYQGLFGYAASNAAIKNLGVAASYIKGNSIVGGLVGWNSGMIKNCYTTGDVYGSSSFVGGLAGENRGIITDSYTAGNVSGSSDSGGLVGKNENGTITNSYAMGNVSGKTVGGLVGMNGSYDKPSGTIANSYATGNVYGSDDSFSDGGGGGLVGYNNGTITDSYAIGDVSGKTIGGLVGKNENGTITNSYATGNVSGSSDSGGLVGDNNGTITDSYATGNVRGKTGMSYGGTAGGLAGWNGGTITDSYAMGYVAGITVGGLVGSNSGTITGSHATGNIKGDANIGREEVTAGGLVGKNRGTITNNYAMGNVSSISYAGGLVGNNSGAITNNYAMGEVIGNISGGLVGKNEYEYERGGTIENSYSIGSVKGTTSTNGGLAGANSSTISKSYYDRQASGQSDIVKGIPKSTAQMKQQATFEGWDFDGIWKIGEINNGYPYLQSSEKSLPVKYKYAGKVQHGQILADKRDGKKYKTVIINTQTWIAENLNHNVKGSKCYGEGNKGYSAKDVQANCTKYGRLYNWKTAMKACPSGWHLPTNKEWNELYDYANMYVDGAGKYLRTTSGWNKASAYTFNYKPVDYDQNGTDDFGFSALPGGYEGISYGGTRRGTYSSFGFGSIGDEGLWWSSTEINSNRAYYLKDFSYSGTGEYDQDKNSLCSVRCVQD